ncbi:CaiB/BaiF CoA transferase family protein [Phreatobacter stygius]|uniref:CoA transferase n=1 Tax=Phreatobacter stygius TaxID=1940610 RepID=A0A4D7BD96_9HYPH|nr:CaiB/BaiF CoA-transferase family protein [Phreatobacter stygius]QCI65907.1 CoA transferase [Phreatobacter stygius]
MLESILSGIKVVDFTQNVAGPFCTQILGDLGAEVIKVERPGRGDDTRDWRPPEIGGQSSTFLALNRNKSSICIDIDQPDGRRVLRDLAATADVFVHSMKPGSAEARGLGHDDLNGLNARLVYCAISAFGQVGPLKGLPGYDPLMQAFTGIMSTTGSPGDDPVRVGVSLIDMGTGMWAALGIMGGLMHRARSGEGMLVEASLMETGISWMTVFVASYLATGRLPQKLGSAMTMTAPYELFASADGHVFIAAGNDRLFDKVCAGLGCPELTQDPRFAANPLRVANRPALKAALEAVTVKKTTVAIVAALRQAGAPCSEMNTVAEMLDHEQVKAAGIVQDLPVETAKDHRVVALPLKANGARSRAVAPPPALGADTRTVLASLGYAAAEIDRLSRQGAVG